jgi:hypothetical protein
VSAFDFALAFAFLLLVAVGALIWYLGKNKKL